MKITNFEWSERLLSYENKIIQRIFANIHPVQLINETLYVDYIGKEEVKDEFNKYFSKFKPEILSLLRENGIKDIKSSKVLDLEKVNWLKSLVEEFQPKNIEFSIKN